MSCPSCTATTTRELPRQTTLGYRVFRCSACRRTYNARTGSPVTHLQVPTDIVLLVVVWRLRDTVSLRNGAEMVLTRGFTFTHETVRAWEERFAPLVAARLKAQRRGKAGRTWHVDETYVKVEGRWCYLYRAIDSDGNRVEAMLSIPRDMGAAKRFFACALETAGQAPKKVTTDGHDSYPRAIRETLGLGVQHHTSRYMNTSIEQDHQGITQRYYPLLGFGSVPSAARFCSAYDELRASCRPRTPSNEHVSLVERRRLFQERWDTVCAFFPAV